MNFADFDKPFLLGLLAVIVVLLIGLIIILIILKSKENTTIQLGTNAVQMTDKGMPYEDIRKFLPFDDIKDNMIVQEKGMEVF